MYGPYQPLQVNWQWGRERKRQAVLTSLAISLKRNREEVIRLLVYTSGSPLASANVSHTGHFALWINVSILARKRKVHENPSLCILNFLAALFPRYPNMRRHVPVLRLRSNKQTNQLYCLEHVERLTGGNIHLNTAANTAATSNSCKKKVPKCYGGSASIIPSSAPSDAAPRWTEVPSRHI